jgi:hypothetical protein
MLAEKTNESEAIFAKHVFVFLSRPDSLGRPGAKVPRSKEARPFFEGSGQIFVKFKRRSRQSARETETRQVWVIKTS